MDALLVSDQIYAASGLSFGRLRGSCKIFLNSNEIYDGNFVMEFYIIKSSP